MASSPPKSGPASPSPLFKRIVLIVALFGTLGFAFWFFGIRPHEEGMRTGKQIERAILKLSTKCPADVSRERWAHCIAWTWQLHTNYGPYSYWDRDERQRFIEELEQRVNGHVDMATIDWIWDQYVESTTGGRDYDGYRPTVPERLEEVDSHPYPSKVDPLREWIQMYESERWKT